MSKEKGFIQGISSFVQGISTLERMVPVNPGKLLLGGSYPWDPPSQWALWEEPPPSQHIPYNSPGMNETPGHLPKTSVLTHLQQYKISDAVPDVVGIFFKYKENSWEFPGGPVVRTLCFHYGGLDSIPGRGTKIPQAAGHGQK